MTYFGFLFLFVGLPILLLLAAHRRDGGNGLTLPAALRMWPMHTVILVHMAVALIYTTPWDNYLVATRVWWYDPSLVTGLTLGWVPIEEYTFFVVQPVLTALWLFWLAKRAPLQPTEPFRNRLGLRRVSTLLIALAWLASVLILISGWKPGVYLGLELSWALIPVILQVAYGADILWRRRRLLLAGLIPATLYLSLADALAIQSGTWTINPQLATGMMLGGVLPVEELLFFFLTNLLVVCGAILMSSQESHQRVNLPWQVSRVVEPS